MNSPPTQRPPCRRASIAKILAGVALAGCFGPEAGAVVTYFNLVGQRSISLRVGSNDAAVNAVTFDVTGASQASATPVQGTPGSGAPLASPAGGIEIELITVNRGASPDVVRLVADSSAGLSCVSGTCGSAIIPFSAISWVSHNLQSGAYAGQDIQSGAFNGSATQGLVSLTVPAGFDSVTLRNALVFSYSNATIYPAGTYSGRVTFTATVP